MVPLTCWFDIKSIRHDDETMCLQQVQVLEAHVLQLLLQLAVAELLWDAVVLGVLLDADKEEGGLEPLQGNGDICYGAEDHFCIEMLYQVGVQSGGGGGRREEGGGRGRGRGRGRREREEVYTSFTCCEKTLILTSSL